VFCAVGAFLGVLAVINKNTISESLLRFGGLLYFGLFFVTISAVEILSGEIRGRSSGPPISSKDEHPTRFWFLVTLQLIFGSILLVASLTNK